jgi:tRNA(Ile)-lysidine synthase
MDTGLATATSSPPPAHLDGRDKAGHDERLGKAIFEILDHRLQPHHHRPIAIALSGGGDSLALTLIADAWARAAGRDLVVLTVDHGLSPLSPAWTAACDAVARRLGRPFRALSWTGDKPAHGLPAAARRARHRLLADAGREAGACVILMGHTADDRREAAAMRAAGSTVPDPTEWAPSPAWPQGRGVFLLRPLLDLRRADLRAWLAARGETWIDDPANADPRYARSRARLSDEPLADGVEAPPLALAAQAAEHAGIIRLPREALRAASSGDARRFIALASVCAGGGDRRPATAHIARAAEALRGEAPVIATLAGARLDADACEVRVFREAGEAARGGLAAVALAAGPPKVWDGRFELTVEAGDVRRLAGLARRLPADQQRALKAIPAAARGALPALLGPDGTVTCPALAGAASLVGARLRAAAGLIDREPG